jgi:hypothetical protein
VDVGAQRLERRDVDDADLVGQRTAKPFLHQVIDRRQECRERLARAGRRGDERVPPLANGRPPAQLRRRGIAQRFGKPAGDERMETGENHGERQGC